MDESSEAKLRPPYPLPHVTILPHHDSLITTDRSRRGGGGAGEGGPATLVKRWDNKHASDQGSMFHGGGMKHPRRSPPPPPPPPLKVVGIICYNMYSTVYIPILQLPLSYYKEMLFDIFTPFVFSVQCVTLSMANFTKCFLIPPVYGGLGERE